MFKMCDPFTCRSVDSDSKSYIYSKTIMSFIENVNYFVSDTVKGEKSVKKGAFAFMKPASELKSIVDKVLSIFYTVVPPSANPIIYSLRNKDIKVALGKLLAVIRYTYELCIYLHKDCEILTTGALAYLKPVSEVKSDLDSTVCVLRSGASIIESHHIQP
ncbi:Olfactory receptor 14A16 [Manis javanica]|nr:Olfactory receptor 14A16 [Manis javanica]